MDKQANKSKRSHSSESYIIGVSQVLPKVIHHNALDLQKHSATLIVAFVSSGDVTLYPKAGVRVKVVLLISI